MTIHNNYYDEKINTNKVVNETLLNIIALYLAKIYQSIISKSGWVC